MLRKNDMPNLATKEKCTGCAACLNRCGVSAIRMEADKTGFLFPVIDSTKCVECKLCERACPVLEKIEIPEASPKAYIVQNKDTGIRMQSTSGGAFTAIASSVIERGGVVYGAAFGDNYVVRHTEEKSQDGLWKFRNSKYVQSEIGNTYKKAEHYLKHGILVCYSGTPCQIQGLKKFLNKDYENLITIDFMCRAVPSPKVFQKYVLYLENKYPSMNKLVFRDKTRGYSYSTLSIYDENNKSLYRGGSEYDQWLRLFFKGYCNRESCYSCQFQTGNRASDFTLWDCWGTQNYAPEWDDNKGTTNVIVWTEKGQKLFTGILNKLKSIEIGMDAIDASLERTTLPRPSFEANIFWNDVEKLDNKAFFDIYAPFSKKIIIKSFTRHLIWKLHLHNAIRKTVHKVRKLRK